MDFVNATARLRHSQSVVLFIDMMMVYGKIISIAWNMKGA